MRQNIVAFYQMHDQVDKLSGYEKYVNKKSIELPSHLEIKALTHEVKQKKLIKIVRDLKLQTENQLGYRVNQPAWSDKSLNRDSVRGYNYYELLSIIRDGYISLGMDIDENFVDDCMEVGFLRSRKSKLILNCDKCKSSNENKEVKYLTNNGKIVNCKLCETCIISFDMNNLEHYEINENDLIIGIKEAKTELESKCENFYKSLDYPLTKESKLYFISINGNFNLNEIDCNGYTSDIIHRIITHLAYIGLFMKFIIIKYYLGSINITPAYKKYQKFANEIYRNKNIDIKVLHNGSTAEMLLKETLCINIYKDPQLTENNLERNSNILLPDYQLNQKHYFYILKNIEREIEISKNLKINVNDLESLDLDMAISELENGFNLHDLSRFFYRRANKIVNNSTLKSKLKYLNNN